MASRDREPVPLRTSGMGVAGDGVLAEVPAVRGGKLGERPADPTIIETMSFQDRSDVSAGK